MSGTRIRIDPLKLRWRNPSAEMLLFVNPRPDSARLLILAPHADDAEIAAFNLYAHRDSWVVTVTNSSYGGDIYADLIADPVRRDSLQAALRVWDSMVVPMWGGLSADRAANLGYFTLHLREMWHAGASPVAHRTTGSTSVAQWRAGALQSVAEHAAESSWDSLVGDIAAIVAEVRPTIIAAPHPALDANVDHVFVTRALLEALRRSGNPELDMFLYTNHHVLSEYYPFGPAGEAVTLPPWLGTPLPVRAVFSLPADSVQQVAKLFALDNMHDLRGAPRKVTRAPASEFLVRLRWATRMLWQDPAGELSYYRRAVRSNELFFRYTSADVELLESMLRTTSANAPDQEHD